LEAKRAKGAKGAKEGKQSKDVRLTARKPTKATAATKSPILNLYLLDLGNPWIKPLRVSVPKPVPPASETNILAPDTAIWELLAAVASPTYNGASSQRAILGRKAGAGTGGGGRDADERGIIWGVLQ